MWWLKKKDRKTPKKARVALKGKKILALWEDENGCKRSQILGQLPKHELVLKKCEKLGHCKAE